MKPLLYISYLLLILFIGMSIVLKRSDMLWVGLVFALLFIWKHFNPDK